VLASLIDKKLVTTAGRKQVIGRPILYKTTKDFLLRFGLKDITELPSMEEFEKMLGAATQEELFEPVAQAGTQAEAQANVDAGPQDAQDSASENSGRSPHEEAVPLETSPKDGTS
jgi:segregation and condensation protein B